MGKKKDINSTGNHPERVDKENPFCETTIDRYVPPEEGTIVDDTIKAIPDSDAPIKISKSFVPCLIVLTGRDVGKLFRLKNSKQIIGRASDVDVVLNDASISRQHARVNLVGDNKVEVLDLDSTNGTFHKNKRIQSTTMEPGDIIKIGSVVTLRFSLLDNIEEKFVSQLYESASQDVLTGLANRRSFMDYLNREISWHQRHEQPLTLIMFDIDFFKKINDTHGHLAGDMVLKQIAKLGHKMARSEDLLSRLGGDEFGYVLRSTGVEGAMIMAERLRKSIEQHSFELEISDTLLTLSVTVSLGISVQSGKQLTTAQNLIAAADECLYASKQQGRNRVTHKT